MEAPEEACVLSFQLEEKRTFSSKVDVKIYCSILKVLDPKRAWLFRFWRPITMKFAIIILHQKFYPVTLFTIELFLAPIRQKTLEIIEFVIRDPLSFL